MRALLPLALALLLYSTSSAGCPPQTPLARVDGHTITLSYYSFVKSRVPEPVFQHLYGNSNRELLNKVVERTLILADAERRGLFNSPELKKRIERFKIKRLGYAYLNSKVAEPTVSEEELRSALSKVPEKERTPQRIKSLKAALKTQKFLSERERVLNSVKKRLKILNASPSSPSTAVAEFEGRKITLKELQPLVSGKPTPEKLKKAALDYSLYLLALKEGLDKTPEFQNLLRSFKERLAVQSFERELYSQVKVSDEEVKSYYESHREEFKLPGKAKVEVWKFRSLPEAKRAMELLKEGKTEELPKPRRWALSSDDANNPLAQLVFSSNRELNLLELPSGEVLLVKTLSKTPPRPMPYGDAYPEVKGKLRSQKFKKLLEEKLSQLRKELGVELYAENLKCLGKE